MPARRFNRHNVRWRACEYCGNDFPDSRRNRRFDKDTCRRNAFRVKRRLKAIEAQGGQCKDCGKRFDPEYAAPFFVLQDGTVVCGTDLSRRSRVKRLEREKSKPLSDQA